MTGTRRDTVKRVVIGLTVNHGEKDKSFNVQTQNLDVELKFQDM